MKGILYVCSSHLGNLADLTYRTVQILQEVSVIYAEDTREFKKIAHTYKIQTPTLSYHLFNEHERLQSVLRNLNQGKNVALICDRGTPVVNDPGFLLIREYAQQGIVRVLPGACAAISAFVLSGFSHRFMFLGFLTKYTELQSFATFPYAIVVFEAPHRVYEFLQQAFHLLGPRKICICRELTKCHEEVIHCNLGAIPEFICKGEFTIVISGCDERHVRIE